MTRFVFLMSAAVLSLGLSAGLSPAPAQMTAGQNPMAPEPDPSTQLMTDCNVPNLEDAAVDSCLDRAHVLQEATPSPDVDLLTSKLEQRSVQRFDPNSLTPPTTQAKAAPEKLDAPDNVTTPPAKLLSSDDANAMDTLPTADPFSVANDDGAKRPVQSDAKLDDGDPPDDNIKDPPPPETPSLRDDPPH